MTKAVSKLMSHVKVLLVEDTRSDAVLISRSLEEWPSHKFDIQHVSTLTTALEVIPNQYFDVAILDLTLPDSDGLATLHALTKALGDVPIVVITGCEREETGVEAVRNGAEEYLIKDEIPAQALPRLVLLAVERRKNRDMQKSQLADLSVAPISVGNLEADIISQKIWIHKANVRAVVPLTPIEFKIFVLVARRPGEVLPRSQIVSEIWGLDHRMSIRTVDKHVSALKRKCSPELDHLQNIYGVGYSLKPFEG